MRFRDSHRVPAAPSDPATQRDRVLAARVVAGDDRAFDILVGHHRQRLVRLAAQITPNGTAEDAVQIAMFNAYKALLRGVVPDDVAAWMNTLCRNAALDRVRRHTPVEPLAAAAVGGSASASAIAEARAELRDILGAVAALPEDERDALMLRAVDGAGHDEIGLELGVTPGQARQLLYRARRRLREATLLVIPAWIPYRAEEAKAAAMRLVDPSGGPLSSPLRAITALTATAAIGTAGVVVAPVVLAPAPSTSSHQRAQAAGETRSSDLQQEAPRSGVGMVAESEDQHRSRTGESTRRTATEAGAGTSADGPGTVSHPTGAAAPKPSGPSSREPAADGTPPRVSAAPGRRIEPSTEAVDERRDASTPTPTPTPVREPTSGTETASSETEDASSSRASEPEDADEPKDDAPEPVETPEPAEPDEVAAPEIEEGDDDGRRGTTSLMPAVDD